MYHYHQNMKDRIHHYILPYFSNSHISMAAKISRAGAKTTTMTSASVLSKNNADDALFDRKIETASEGLTPYYCKRFYKIPLVENSVTLANYILSMKSEINPSDNYRREVIEKISGVSICFGRTLFTDITRKQILNFLDAVRKPEASDPLHKWIGTYNIYRMHLIRFFKWLYYPDIEPQKRPKPRGMIITKLHTQNERLARWWI
jgi:hypothetical protein